MPDWLTHMGIGYIIVWVISKIPKYDKRLRKYFWMFIIGMVAPDIERIFRVIAQQIDSSFLMNLSFSFTLITHSIIGAVIVSLFLTAFFPHEKDTKYIFLTIFFGSIGHLLTDMVMWPWKGMGLSLFYPLTGSEFVYSFHLVWPGGFIPLIITAFIILGTVCIDLVQRNLSVFNFKIKKI